ncbi:MAG TPA: hypothetical protein VGJ22_14765 [Anaerolineales bacterium]|jgi:hypothetical protein
MKKLTTLMVMILAACAPGPTPPAVVAPAATAFIDASYPTALADVAAPYQRTNGIDVLLNRAWIDGKSLNAEVCFTLPDGSDWSVWAASLNYGETVLQEYGTTLVSVQEPANGQAGLRCDTLTFIVAPDADLTRATITIDSLGNQPREGDYCSVYVPKIQAVLLERGIGIALDCVDVGGALTMQIANKPPEMTQEEAEQIVYSDEFYTIKGPWTFALSLSQ